MREADIRDDTIDGFLRAVAARQPAPGGGAVTAVSVAAAAALVAMAARFSSGLDDVAARMDALRGRALQLAEADARAYEDLLGALRLPGDAADRGERVSGALVTATEVPLAMGRVAREVASAAARTVADGNPNLRGDAVAGAVLAAASARSAAHLVHLNASLGDVPDDPVGEARQCRADAEEAARKAEGDT